MRRLLALLMAACFVLTITACSKGTNDTMKEATEENNTKPTDEAKSEAPTVAPTATPTPTPTVAPTEAPAAKDEPVFEVTDQNLIPGGYFDQQDTKWGTYTESGGFGMIAVNENGQLEVTIENTGSVGHAVQVYCDGFALLQNAEYELSFDISSTVERTMEWRIQLNGGDYRPYVSEEHAAITKEVKHFSHTFIMEEPSDPAPRFCFNLGFQEADGELAPHTVTIDNVELYLKDASKADASAN